MSKHVVTIVLVVVFLVGLSVLIYPTVSDYLNTRVQSKEIAQYTDVVNAIDDETYRKLLEEAHAYNRRLLDKESRYVLSDEELAEYYQQLALSENGAIAYLEIPSIQVQLPVYHDTNEAVLRGGVGHIPGSSLPVGGENTHAVLSGHRALPTATLLTDLDKVVEGDVFRIHVLDETLTYEVDQILIVDPDDFSALHIVEGEDLVTLVTCTPVMINTHRLLVRGHRIANEATASNLRVTADAVPVDSMIIALLVSVPIVLSMFLYFFIRQRIRKGRGWNP